MRGLSDTAITGFPPLEGVVRGDDVPGNHSMDEVLTQHLGYPVTSGEPYWISGCNTSADALAGTCVFPGQFIPHQAKVVELRYFGGLKEEEIP